MLKSKKKQVGRLRDWGPFPQWKKALGLQRVRGPCKGKEELALREVALITNRRMRGASNFKNPHGMEEKEKGEREHHARICQRLEVEPAQRQINRR